MKKTKFNTFKVLAIIPARGGSKGVPKKNTLEFEGKTLIQYALDCALGSHGIDNILINSDETEILNSVDDSMDTRTIVKQLRPANLAQDKSSIVDVVINALQHMNEEYDIILLLQVTSPIRTSQDIDNILDYFIEDKKLEGVISVIPVDDNHPSRMYTIDKSKTLTALNTNFESHHRQDLNHVYLRNGCFYAVRTEAFLKQRTFMPKNKKGYIMKAEHHLNIDSPRDVIIAEALIKSWLENTL